MYDFLILVCRENWIPDWEFQWRRSRRSGNRFSLKNAVQQGQRLLPLMIPYLHKNNPSPSLKKQPALAC